MDRRLAVPLAVLVSSCVWTFQGVEVAPLERHPGDSVAVVSPVKAHLLNGSTVVFRDGVHLVRDTLRGLGTRYDLTLRDSTAVMGLALDSVVGIEVFRTPAGNSRHKLRSAPRCKNLGFARCNYESATRHPHSEGIRHP